MAKIRTGDTVQVSGLNETWTVAYADYETGKLAPCGFPDSEVSIERCELVRSATGDEYLDLVAELAISGDRRGERATRIAARDIGA